MTVPDAQTFDLWGAVLAALFAANMALVGVIYRGMTKRMDKTDKFLGSMAGGFVALATTLAPDKAPAIIRDFVAQLVEKQGGG